MSADARQEQWCIVVRPAEPREVGLQQGTSGAVVTVAVSVRSGDLPATGIEELVEDANVGATQRALKAVLAKRREQVRRSLALYWQGEQRLVKV